MHKADKLKPVLPYGWVVKQSKSYPDRVYYFNINTGASTWEVPDLIKPFLAQQHHKHAEHSHHVTVPHKNQATMPPRDFSHTTVPPKGSGMLPTVEARFSPEPQFSPEMESDGSTTPRLHDNDDSDDDAPFNMPHTEHFYTDKPGSGYVGFQQQSVRPGIHCINPNHVFQPVNSVPVARDKTYKQSHGGDQPKLDVTSYSKQKQDLKPVSLKSKQQETNSTTNIQREGLKTSVTSVGSAKSNKSAKSTTKVDLSKFKTVQNQGTSQNSKISANSQKTLKHDKSLVSPNKKIKISPELNDDSVRSKTGSQVPSAINSSKVSSPRGKKRKVENKTEQTDMVKPKLLKVTKKTSKIDKTTDIRKVVQSDSVTCTLNDLKDDDVCRRDRTHSGESSVNSIKSPHITDPEKIKSIQTWIDQLQPGDPPSDPVVDLVDGLSSGTSDTKRTSPDSGILNVTYTSDCDNRRVVLSSEKCSFKAGDSGYSASTGLTAVQDNQFWKTLMHNTSVGSSGNPWKDVHAQPPVVRQNMVVDMEIDEVQHELSKAETRYEEDMEVCEIAVKEVREHLKKCPDEVIGKLTENVSKEMDTSLSEVIDQGLLIVVDTNVWLDDLGFIEDLRDQHIKDYGCPILVIPWVVMQELDALKNMKRKNWSNVLNLSLATEKKARAAVNYIFNCFEIKHPRIHGQTPKQAKEAVSSFEAENNDDKILQCCLQCKQNYSQSHTIFLTNDKNLTNKATVLSVEAYSRHKLLSLLQGKTTTSLSSSKGKTTTEKQSVLQKEGVNKTADTILCKAKTVIKTALSIVLEKEMKAAYNDIWLDIVIRKPPWTLVDVLECMKRHWMAVFGFICKRNLKENVEALLNKFKPFKEPFAITMENIQTLLRESGALLEGFLSASDYGLHFKDAVREHKTLEKMCIEERTSTVTSPQVQAESSEVHSPPKTPEDTSQAHQLAEAKFERIWQTVNKCCLALQRYIESGSHDPGQREEAITMITRLVSIVKDLRYFYAFSLTFSPEEIHSTASIVHDVCIQVNNFFPRMEIEDEGSVSVEDIQSLFGNPDKRQLLQTGLQQLDEMIKKLYSYVKMMPD